MFSRFVLVGSSSFAVLFSSAIAAPPDRILQQGLAAFGVSEGAYFQVFANREGERTLVSFWGPAVSCAKETSDRVISMPTSGGRGSISVQFSSEECFDGVGRSISVECRSDDSLRASFDGNGTLKTLTSVGHFQYSSQFDFQRCELTFDGATYPDLYGRSDIVREQSTINN